MDRKALMLLIVITLLNIIICGRCQTEQSAIAFPDPNLEAVIREAIDKPEGDIYASDLEGIILLNADGGGIRNITGLEYCRNLEYLSLRGNEITDVSPLSGLTNLTELDLSFNEINDVSLSRLTSLEWLRLDNNQIVDISPLFQSHWP